MQHRILSIKLALLGGLLTIVAGLNAATSYLDLTLPDDADLRVTVFPSNGPRRVIWLPSVFGQAEAEEALLARLSNAGIEVWLADVLANRFLPRVNSSLDAIPAGDIATVVQAAVSRDDKRVFLVGVGRGAVPVLRGADFWSRTQRGSLHGILLLWPSLYVKTPEPGMDAEYLPVIHTLNTPLAVYQPELSVRFWYMDRLQSALEAAHVPVLMQSVPGVRDGFYLRGEPLEAEIRLIAGFPSQLRKLLEQLEELEP